MGRPRHMALAWGGVGLLATLWAVAAPPAGPVEVAIHLERDGAIVAEGASVPLAAPMQLVVTVKAPRESRVFVPTNPAIRPFRIMGPSAPVERRSEVTRLVEVHRLPVAPVGLGVKGLPSMDVDYRLADGTVGTVATPRLRVHIARRLANEESPRLAEAPAPQPIITTNWALIWSLSILGSVLFAILVTMLVMRLLKGRLEALIPLPPPRPADEVALERLLWLQTSDLEAEGLFAEVVDVLREYLGQRYGFDGLEMTTREFRSAIATADLGDVLPQEVHGLLDEADLVKFARVVPAREASLGMIPVVQRIVTSTWVPPEPDEPDEEDERIRHEAATLNERLRAAALDGLLVGALDLVLLGALWATGHLALAWLLLPATGLLLGVRDALGSASPGKRLIGLMLVRRDAHAERAPLGPRLLRNALYLVPPVGVPVEFMVLMQHPLRWTVGDTLSRVEVVRVPGRRGPASAAGEGS